jgi:hypothetical protein
MLPVDVKVVIVDTEFSAIQLLNPSSQPVWMFDSLDFYLLVIKESDIICRFLLICKNLQLFRRIILDFQA